MYFKLDSFESDPVLQGIFFPLLFYGTLGTNEELASAEGVVELPSKPFVQEHKHKNKQKETAFELYILHDRTVSRRKQVCSPYSLSRSCCWKTKLYFRTLPWPIPQSQGSPAHPPQPPAEGNSERLFQELKLRLLNQAQRISPGLTANA